MDAIKEFITEQRYDDYSLGVRRSSTTFNRDLRRSIRLPCIILNHSFDENKLRRSLEYRELTYFSPFQE